MVRSRKNGEVLVVSLSGEIDHCAADAMRGEIEALLKDTQVRRLIFNFEDVSFMDSSGVGMIIGRYKTMRARGGSVGACGLHPPVDRLFTLAGLHRIIAQEDAERQENA